MRHQARLTARHCDVKLSDTPGMYQVPELEQELVRMMGKTHAVTGLATGIGISLYAVHLPVLEATAGIVVCTGAALLPDIDHDRSTVSNTYGPVTRGFCRAMNKISGGHRRGTHSIPGILALGLVLQAAVLTRGWVLGQVILCLALILTLAGAVRLLKIPGWIDDMAPIPFSVGLVFMTDIPLTIVPPALVLGCLVHLVGDLVTKQPIPIWWPLDKGTVAMDLFKTNGWTERCLVYPGSWIGIVALIMWKVFDSAS